ncbi:hypothetical protein LEP1GSC193_0924 [Leptospira alstonii serovar Pingchang str. 80-412]|uniref:Uncharacterized protein n=2 Tax=Leptospira alstonii TaxID=28452 RepID=M6CXZ1_9LEPT|nr:hypothetical protein LEP1GSC194_3703 [Leptospira alstonii serovar Sichuan str. 79601]EQA80082.1 hypothetical protein LEP1GSC193_0924 [Leptospira alstonii serovar Pingchang str. 80-412]
MIFTLLSGTATWITFIILYILNKKYTSFLTNYFFHLLFMFWLVWGSFPWLWGSF